mgnify:CR=1 FL=1
MRYSFFLALLFLPSCSLSLRPDCIDPALCLKPEEPAKFAGPLAEGLLAEAEHVASGSRYAIAAQGRETAAAGERIFSQGGNIIDAAVAPRYAVREVDSIASEDHHGTLAQQERDQAGDPQRIMQGAGAREIIRVRKLSYGVGVERLFPLHSPMIDKIELAKEDMIKLGSTILKYLPAGQLETLYHINLTNAASMDKLTGLYNRKYISEVLEVEFKRAKALHSNISVVLFDIDNFKKINDTYGHDGGDFVLTTLGEQVKASGLRERDLAGRYGGEEFIVVLTNSTSQQAADVAERIRKRIESHEFVYDSKRIAVTVSLGVATIRKDFHVGADLYKEADKALYESKKNGKNQVTIAKGE